MGDVRILMHSNDADGSWPSFSARYGNGTDRESIWRISSEITEWLNPLPVSVPTSGQIKRSDMELCCFPWHFRCSSVLTDTEEKVKVLQHTVLKKTPPKTQKNADRIKSVAATVGCPISISVVSGYVSSATVLKPFRNIFNSVTHLTPAHASENAISRGSLASSFGLFSLFFSPPKTLLVIRYFPLSNEKSYFHLPSVRLLRSFCRFCVVVGGSERALFEPPAHIPSLK